MKYTGIGLLLLMLAAPGCLPVPVAPDQPSGDVMTKDNAAAAKPGLVKPDDVTEANAHEVANALQAELDRAVNEKPADEKPLKVRP
jgi:hypothetical protein